MRFILQYKTKTFVGGEMPGYKDGRLTPFDIKQAYIFDDQNTYSIFGLTLEEHIEKYKCQIITEEEFIIRNIIE